MPNNRTRRGKSFGAGPPKRANNAELHGMDGSVTPRAIAYAAVQVGNTLRLSPRLTLLSVALQSHGRDALDELL